MTRCTKSNTSKMVWTMLQSHDGDIRMKMWRSIRLETNQVVQSYTVTTCFSSHVSISVSGLYFHTPQVFWSFSAAQWPCRHLQQVTICQKRFLGTLEFWCHFRGELCQRQSRSFATQTVFAVNQGWIHKTARTWTNRVQSHSAWNHSQLCTRAYPI